MNKTSNDDAAKEGLGSRIVSDPGSFFLDCANDSYFLTQLQFI